MDLINKIKSNPVTYPFTLISFDVKSLFTNVNLDDPLSYLNNYLPDTFGNLSKGVLIDLIELCFKHNKFTFNGKLYLQKFGVSMGNALESLWVMH